ncbi:hypothetical protein E4T42_02828 [Aureobasidium subglaciale]|nr:hypothetical protein E4T42_02828 [Aureobasidium subglaciale]
MFLQPLGKAPTSMSEQSLGKYVEEGTIGLCLTASGIKRSMRTRSFHLDAKCLLLCLETPCRQRLQNFDSNTCLPQIFDSSEVQSQTSTDQTVPFSAATMVTYNMSTAPEASRRVWSRPSDCSTDLTNQFKLNEQLPPPNYYAAPNHFSTPNYNAEASPVAAAAEERRSGTSRYSLPSSLPSSFEMQDLSGPSNTQPTNELPPPATQTTEQTSLPQRTQKLMKSAPMFPMLLVLVLCVITIALNLAMFTKNTWNHAMWSRWGFDEALTTKQVIFTTIPSKVI